MSNNTTARENISALADGELDNGAASAAIASLRNPEERAAWDAYHQVGDVLRSDDMAVQLSAGFSEKMAARLAAEPILLAPKRDAIKSDAVRPAARCSLKRLLLPGAAVAAAALAFISGPQLMVASQDAAPTETVVAVSAGGSVDGTMLRDPRIDEYLMAHQRFSPSPYSTAQFARSASFAGEAEK